jgi:hypothetical protein
MHMQIMKMMHAKSAQAQAQGAQKAGQGQGQGTKPVGFGKTTATPGQQFPYQIPKSTSSGAGAGNGTNARAPSLGTGSTSLQAKLPPARIDQPPSQITNTSQNLATGKYGDNISENGNVHGNGMNGMKCPNCGITVQSGWFLCPACKSPLN